MATDKPVSSIKVRMYRHGFGDCFLLRFFEGSKTVFSMLIDCGIKYNTKSEEVPIEDVIDDLKKTLKPEGGGRPQLDVLVATHEHWDHIAYFHPDRFKKDFFADFDIGRVWLAWTENPKDKVAKQINSRLRDGVAALSLAAERLEDSVEEEVGRSAGLYFGGRVREGRESFSDRMDDVMGFYGVTSKKRKKRSNKLEEEETGIKYKPNGKISTMTEAAMENIIKLGKSGGVEFLEPGTVVNKSLLPDGVDGVNIYVLGPPKTALLNKSNPSRGESRETYEKEKKKEAALSIDSFGMSSFIDGLLGMGEPASAQSAQRSCPFDPEQGISREDAEQDPYLAETYFAPQEAYRKIENNWLDIAGQFALQLDGAINNTSLVLAIELASSDSGSSKVLLFPGDAQVGSWVSWHQHNWKVQRGAKTETVTAKDLLNKTVLYKVSHHGSHNATVKDLGLEMMLDPELVAMIPEKEKSYSGILFQPLMDRLDELCKGRVLVSADSEHRPEDLLEGDKPQQLSKKQWQDFKDDLVVETAYVEYTIRS